MQAVPLLSVRTWDKELQNFMINMKVQTSNNKPSELKKPPGEKKKSLQVNIYKSKRKNLDLDLDNDDLDDWECAWTE